MADEITVTTGLAVSKTNGPSLSRPAAANQYDMAGNVIARDVTSVPTTSAGTALDVASVSNLGWAYFANLDSTNYVEIGVQVSGTFYPFLRLLAGAKCVVPLSSSATLYARANTAAVNLDFEIVEA